MKDFLMDHFYVILQLENIAKKVVKHKYASLSQIKQLLQLNKREKNVCFFNRPVLCIFSI